MGKKKTKAPSTKTVQVTALEADALRKALAFCTDSTLEYLQHVEDVQGEDAALQEEARLRRVARKLGGVQGQPGGLLEVAAALVGLLAHLRGQEVPTSLREVVDAAIEACDAYEALDDACYGEGGLP